MFEIIIFLAAFLAQHLLLRIDWTELILALLWGAVQIDIYILIRAEVTIILLVGASLLGLLWRVLNLLCKLYSEMEPKERHVLEIPGAIQKWYTLAQAACLLGAEGATPRGPLKRQSSKDWYRVISYAVGKDWFGAEKAFEYGWRQAGRENGAPEHEHEHELEIERKSLRNFLKSINFPIPKFLDELFDESDDSDDSEDS